MATADAVFIVIINVLSAIETLGIVTNAIIIGDIISNRQAAHELAGNMAVYF